MLLQFTMENHRSIKSSAVVSFLASRDKSLEEYLLHPDTKKPLLPAIAIYGANAAGKSNVLHAMMTMKDMVIGDASKVSKGQKLPWEPFSGYKEPTSFEIVFLYQGVRYAYGFSFDAESIHSEYLYHWPNGREALIFSRENGVYEFRENISEQITLSNRTPDNKLYLVSSNDWNLPQTESAFKWFLEKLTFLMEEEPDASETVAQIVHGGDRKARILKELLIADLGITDVSVKNISLKMPIITTTHRIIHENGSTEYFQLLMDQESAGTQHFFTRIGGWLQALENGALLVVDEIEDSLHPLLTRRLIEMVQDQSINTRGTQLLFTTHDAMLLDLTLFRRDQIWFAEKNEKTCATELFSLASFSARKGENVRRGYLQGRFGAIPFIGGDSAWQR
ncbi:MAG TPA: ATP-binding protein [Lachnospiraceae bacterium]|nr:ATP-binding protein [Lachnospiraceae bacterium]